MKIGRHFRLGPATKVVVGRNKTENDVIDSLSCEKDLVLRVENIPGPTVLITGEASPEEEALALSITASYSDAKEDQVVEVTIAGRGLGEGQPGEKVRSRAASVP